MAPELGLTRLAGSGSSERLTVVGPSLGTPVALLWRECAQALARELDSEVIGWDLPGHGASPPTAGPFTVRDVAGELQRRVTELGRGRPAAYAGVSFGGAVGFELAAGHGGPFDAVVCIGAARRIGLPAMWHERAALVRTRGTPVVVEGSAQRWFAPGFAGRRPQVAGALLTALAGTDRESYARACEALAEFEGGRSATPVRVLVGEHDVVVPPDGADRVLAGCGHLPPAEDPVAVARVVAEVLEEMRCPTTTA
ncbi:alpha/beta fold hydrolase [Lentzea sp. NPDC060358]|uniref:alpha/beta fold hydrolase n=1 Tax=Lentzea sp. NPDC060358 TaxID=3347103 RepID=UPI00364A1107